MYTVVPCFRIDHCDRNRPFDRNKRINDVFVFAPEYAYRVRTAGVYRATLYILRCVRARIIILYRDSRYTSFRAVDTSRAPPSHPPVLRSKPEVDRTR
jgi:hypothetical protein